MSFRFQPVQPFDAEVRRIAAEQIEKAENELADPKIDRHEAIHDVRKRFKKLRALLRLARPADAGLYARENARMRDAARALSGARDRTALIEAVDALETHFENEVVTDAFAGVRAALEERRRVALEAEGDLDVLVARTLDELAASRADIDALAVRGARRRAARLAAGGYARTYREARRALRRAEKTRHAEDLHLLRKHVKYHGHHLALLAALWPEALKAPQEAAGTIADDLGRDHDYAVFRAELTAEPEAFGDRAHLDVVLALMDRRQDELRETALRSARRLLALKPKAARAMIRTLFREAARLAEAPEGLPAEGPEADARAMHA